MIECVNVYLEGAMRRTDIIKAFTASVFLGVVGLSTEAWAQNKQDSKTPPPAVLDSMPLSNVMQLKQFKLSVPNDKPYTVDSKLTKKDLRRLHIARKKRKAIACQRNPNSSESFYK